MRRPFPQVEQKFAAVVIPILVYMHNVLRVSRCSRVHPVTYHVSSFFMVLRKPALEGPGGTCSYPNVANLLDIDLYLCQQETNLATPCNSPTQPSEFLQVRLSATLILMLHYCISCCCAIHVMVASHQPQYRSLTYDCYDL